MPVRARCGQFSALRLVRHFRSPAALSVNTAPRTEPLSGVAPGWLGERLSATNKTPTSAPMVRPPEALFGRNDHRHKKTPCSHPIAPVEAS
jgi:hypothetical protein